MMIDYTVYHLFNDLASKANSNHTHTEYITESQVTTIVSNSIESGEISVNGSMIRKITRGTATATTSGVTISCSITNVDKVIVILDADYSVASASTTNNYETSCLGAGNSSVYLVSVSTTGIVVKGGAPSTNNSSKPSIKTTSITFSYQIIEFM